MPPSLLGGGMASGGLGAAAPNRNIPADNAPQLAAGWFTLAGNIGGYIAQPRAAAGECGSYTYRPGRPFLLAGIAMI